MKDKEKQIEEMANDICSKTPQECVSMGGRCNCLINERALEKLYNAAYRKMPKDSVVLTKEELEEKYEPSEKFMSVARELEDLKQSLEDCVVLSREEYDAYQSFKNGDYCATKCDIHELSFNQMNKISDLENENEKLKKEIKNPNEVLEDRERFRARNEELKGIIEQLRQEIITLSQELVNSRKETAEKFYKKVRKLLKKVDIVVDGEEGFVGYEESAVDKGLTELAKQFGVEIKE